jgi:hypothetical protein
MRYSLLVSVILALVVSAVAPAFAHNGTFGSVETPLEWVNTDNQSFIHADEQDPWKGTAFVYVKNTGTKAWTDFHFKIYCWNGVDDISNVSFTDASMGGIDPTSTQSPLTWSINNVVVGAEMSLYFASDPVLPGQVATFQVYTDNTTDNVQFGMCMCPSVPEPSAILALTTGLFGMFGVSWRRRRK